MRSMRSRAFSAVLAAMLAFCGLLTLAGCGAGGGDDDDNDDNVSRQTLAGTGSTVTGGVTTSKRWRTIFLKVNSSYVGTGADQPCPVEVQSVSGGLTTSCDLTSYLELRSDGAFRSVSVNDPSGVYDDIWTYSNGVLSTTNNSSFEGESATVVAVFRVTDEGVVNGRQRLRLRTISETDTDGVTLRPTEVGFELVIEEIITVGV